MSTLTIGGSQLDTSWFLLLAAVLFILGTIGVLIRRNPLVILICIELMLNAVNLTLITFSRQLQNLEGQLFALMGPAKEIGRSRLKIQTSLSALFVLALFGLLWAMLQGVQYRQPEQTDLNAFGTVQWIGVYLFTNYLYPFELTSILLLVAAIGAIYLSRKRIDDL